MTEYELIKKLNIYYQENFILFYLRLFSNITILSVFLYFVIRGFNGLKGDFDTGMFEFGKILFCVIYLGVICFKYGDLYTYLVKMLSHPKAKKASYKDLKGLFIDKDDKVYYNFYKHYYTVKFNYIQTDLGQSVLKLDLKDLYAQVLKDRQEFVNLEK